MVFGQTDPPPEAVDDLLNQHRRLMGKLDEFTGQRHADEETLKVLEQIAVVEKKLVQLLEADDSVVESLMITHARLVNRYEALERYADAIAAQQEVVNAEIKLHGNSDFRVNDSRLRLSDLKRISSLTTGDRELLKQSISQNQRAVELLDEQKFAEAERLLCEALVTLEKYLGSGSLSAIKILRNLAVNQNAQGRIGESLTQFREVKNRRFRSQGLDHPEYRESLYELADAVQVFVHGANRAEAFDTAKLANDELIQVLIELHGEQDYRVTDGKLAGVDIELKVKLSAEERQELAKAGTLNAKVIELLGSGQCMEALPLALSAIEIRKRLIGEQHRDYASSLNNLAALYESMGDYARAEPQFLQAKAIEEKVLGKVHPDYATSLVKLTELYYSMGDYARVEPLLLEAKAVREKVLGKEHPAYASILNILAVTYESMGHYTRAEPLLLEAQAIYEKVFGKEDPLYAESLTSLASLYREMSDYARAEPLCVEAKAINERVLGKEHPDYVISLTNLALLYDSMGDYTRAEPLYLEAVAIYEKVPGKEHPDYVTILNKLALLYLKLGAYTRAEPLFIEANEIAGKVLGKEHSLYAVSLNDLGGLYTLMRDYARAEPLLLEANEIAAKMLGKEHPNYATTLNNLAELYGC